MMRERCYGCANTAVLYITGRLWACENCLMLGIVKGRMSYNPHNPLSQPDPLRSNYGGKPKPCINCGESSVMIYRWRNGREVYACGWGCAGIWMDKETERLVWEEDELEAEQYVRKSLGMVS